VIFGVRSWFPNFRSRRLGLEDAIFVQMLALFRIETERLKLPAPFSRRISEPLDADAAGQAAFHGCLDETGREKREGDGHIDLSGAALLAGAKLGDGCHPT
jgi:hypothetical protein